MDWAIIFFWFFLFQMVFAWLPWFIIILAVAGKQFKVKQAQSKIEILSKFIKENNLTDKAQEYIKGVVASGTKM